LKRALIFGIKGFVGYYLSQELQSNGYIVYGSDIIAPSSNLENYTQADLINEQQVFDVVNAIQPDIIINLAAISSVGQSWSIPAITMQVNVIGVLHVLEGARKCESKPKVLLIGSSEEYINMEEPIDESAPLNANNPYGISKITQEQFASLYRKRYGLKVYCVRAFNHTGVGQRDTFVIPNLCMQAARISCSGKTGTMKVGNLSVKRDLCDVRDTVRAYRIVLESDNCEIVYNIGSGKAIALGDVLSYLKSLSKQRINVEVDPALIRPIDAPVICSNNSLIRKMLGWEPNINIFDTIQEMFSYYCGEFHVKD